MQEKQSRPPSFRPKGKIALSDFIVQQSTSIGPEYEHKSTQPNSLDSRTQTRGKEKEFKKEKQPTPMKKIIIKSREEKYPSNINTTATSTTQQTHPETEKETIQKQQEKPTPHKIPRLPNSNNPREFITHLLSPQLISASKEFISKTHGLDQKAKETKGKKYKKKYVCGLKEVKKKLQVGKTKCIFLAHDLEEVAAEGGLDNMANEIFHLAKDKDIPVIFSLNRRKLGQALGKNIHTKVHPLTSTQ